MTLIFLSKVAYSLKVAACHALLRVTSVSFGTLIAWCELCTLDAQKITPEQELLCGQCESACKSTLCPGVKISVRE